MEKIKCAVVGTGIFGEIHVHTYSTYDKAELLMICDLNEKRAKEISKKYGVRYTTDYSEIAENDKIEAVSVATPDFAHKDIVIKMLESGKHVLVEKPMATSIEEAEVMVETAKKSGKILMTDFHNRFNPPFVLAREKFESGDIGDIGMIYTRLSDRIDVPLKWFSWSNKTGPQWFLFPHIVDLVTWISGKKPEKVYGCGKKGILKSNGIDIYDTVTGILDFGKFYATVETSWIVPESWPSIADFYFKIEGSKGRIEIDFEDLGLKMASDVKKEMETPFYLGYTPIDGKPHGFASLPIMHFVDCISENRKPIISVEDGFINVKIISSILESIETGKPVKI